MNNIVEFEHVTLIYDKTNVVLNDISFNIKQGEYVSLIGANGAGKSTIARLIMGLVEKTKGTIKISDIEINEKNIDSLRKEIGMVFQNPDNQFIGNTVADDVAFRLENIKMKQSLMDDIIDSKLKEVDMLQFKKYEPSNLSGGQKQRIAIAANIVCDLKLLILDEATSMIDPKGRNEIAQVISRIREENPNIAILAITHNMEEVLYSSRAIVLNENNIQFDGTPHDLFTNVELLNKFKLKEPFKYELVRKLNNEGFAVNLEDSTDEIANKICQ